MRSRAALVTRRARGASEANDAPVQQAVHKLQAKEEPFVSPSGDVSSLAVPWWCATSSAAAVPPSPVAHRPTVTAARARSGTSASMAKTTKNFSFLITWGRILACTVEWNRYQLLRGFGPSGGVFCLAMLERVKNGACGPLV